MWTYLCSLAWRDRVSALAKGTTVTVEPGDGASIEESLDGWSLQPREPGLSSPLSWQLGAMWVLTC